MTRKVLMAIRTQLDAIQIMLDGLIEDIEQAPVDNTVCLHKASVSTGVFGNPDRRYCPDCNLHYQAHGVALTETTEGGVNHG